MMARLAVLSMMALMSLAARTPPSQSKKAHGKKAAARHPTKHAVRRIAPAGSQRRTSVKRAALRHALAPIVSNATRAVEIDRVEARLSTPQSHFENAAALVPFFELLKQARAMNTSVHVLQFGDSHTASDDWVNAMRLELQSRYGAGGAGFVLPGHPFRGYRRFDISGSGSDDWTTEGTVMHQGDGREGLSGISITAHSRGQTITLRSSSRSVEIHYLQQPDGGDLEFTVDGQLGGVISTKGEICDGIYKYAAQAGEHDYRLTTLSSNPVRLFGWASDETSGITFETLGINGAQANLILNWNAAIWQQEMASRQPALVILEYGTNEANSPKWVAEQYVTELENVLTRVRRAAPLASILMIGPPDCGKTRPLTHLDEVIAIQRRVARMYRVAFWDWRERMGGPRSVVEWVRAGLGQADHVHLTGVGYRLIGKTLMDELEAEHALYLAAQSDQATVQPAPAYAPTN